MGWVRCNSCPVEEHPTTNLTPMGEAFSDLRRRKKLDQTLMDNKAKNCFKEPTVITSEGRGKGLEQP